jgi:predicted outer membrane repeat protein
MQKEKSMHFRTSLFLIALPFSFACKDKPATDTGDCGTNELFADLDGDGFGDPNAPVCEGDDGVSDATDCDDTQSAIHPDATEDCETEFDDNCNQETNEENAANCADFFVDEDGDGAGGLDSTCFCEPSGAYLIAQQDDCDDSRPEAYPYAIEFCNGLQEDCTIANWEASDEDGLVSLESLDGSWSDKTQQFTGSVTLTESGVWHVCEGNYNASLSVINLKDVRLQGRGDVEDILIRGTNNRALLIDQSVVEVEGMSFQGNLPDETGGAIYLDSSKVPLTSGGYHLSLVNTVIRNSEGTQGAGIYIDDSYALIQDSEIYGNSAIFGGGLAITSGVLEIDNTDFYGNTSSFLGGALAGFSDSKITIKDSDLYENESLGAGGGVGLDGGPTLDLIDSTIRANTTGNLGGGIYASDATISCEGISNAKAGIYNNGRSVSKTNYGFGVSMLPTTQFTSTNCDFGEITSHTQSNNSPADLCLYTKGSSTCERHNYDNNASFICKVNASNGVCN